ncbi:MAG: phosphatase PAP2 family protein [Leucobacter sp.]
MTSRGRAAAIWPVVLWALVGVASYLIGVRLAIGQLAEDSVLDAAEFTYDPPPPLNLVSVPTVAVAVIAVGVIAYFANSLRRAIVVVVIPALAILASQLLKQELLTRPQLFELSQPNTFPSGHMTVFMSLVAALVWAVPSAVRSIVAAVGAAVLAAVSWQLLAYGWHRPSDVLGGLALGTLSFAIAALIHPLTMRERPALGRSVPTVLLILGLIGVAVALGIAAVAAWLANSSFMLIAGEVGVAAASVLAARTVLILATPR